MSEVHSAQEARKHVRAYLIVFAALAALTVSTVAVAYLHLPTVPAVTVALFIAAVKGSLVAGYFMHLISEKRLIHAILALTVVFLIGMFTLTGLGFSDQDMTGK